MERARGVSIESQAMMRFAYIFEALGEFMSHFSAQRDLGIKYNLLPGAEADRIATFHFVSFE